VGSSKPIYQLLTHLALVHKYGEGAVAFAPGKADNKQEIQVVIDC